MHYVSISIDSDLAIHFEKDLDIAQRDRKVMTKRVF